jgi:hypothetical protein
VSVLLGHGNGSFANQTRYPTAPSPQSVAIGDLNSDARLDIVVANYGSDNVSVLLGYGDGSFANQITYLTGFYPQSVDMGDFNNDTLLDIVVANFDDADANDVSVLLGYSNQVFAKQTVLTTGNGSQPRSRVICDFNNDDRMDIGIANMGTQNISIFLGYGNISFTNQATYSTGPHSSPYSIAVGDFNSETWLDIFVANYGSENVGIFLGDGNGSFGNQTTYLTASDSYLHSVGVGDFDNDNILDIVVANYGTNNLCVLLGHGNGTFGSPILFLMDYGSHPFSVVVGDFNNDRKLDLAVANNGTDSLYILLQTC